MGILNTLVITVLLSDFVAIKIIFALDVQYNHVKDSLLMPFSSETIALFVTVPFGL